MKRVPHPGLLHVEELYVHFPVHSTFMRRSSAAVRAVDGVTLTVAPGETVGLVGESGCGKTTLGWAILKLVTPTAGRVLFDGTDLASLKGRKLRLFRRHLQLIFQDPYGSLNPRMTVYNIVGEAPRVHGLVKSKAQQREKVASLLETVGLRRDFIYRYPHELSGGQRQRIGIARALALEPRFIVADEPLSALDVSIQAQIVNLLKDLQEKLKISLLFITHDLKMVKFLSHTIAVMYLGRIVEVAQADELFLHPLHPYTRALMEAIPVPDPLSRWQPTTLKGEIPSPIDPPTGCHFRTRCPHAFETCERLDPHLLEVQDGHHVACHLVKEPEEEKG
jgi:oligopeptide/dipeptide ABC transporter ATP-binding protein